MTSPPPWDLKVITIFTKVIKMEDNEAISTFSKIRDELIALLRELQWLNRDINERIIKAESRINFLSIELLIIINRVQKQVR